MRRRSPAATSRCRGRPRPRAAPRRRARRAARPATRSPGALRLRRRAARSARVPRVVLAANPLRQARPETLAAYHVRMLGGGSITLFHFRGSRVSVDWSWFIVLFLVILYMTNFFEGLLDEGGTTPFLFGVLSAVGFFGSILLHEFGHAVVARRNGIGITGIQLWIFGGMARMDREADSPGTELKVALAGPAVTFAIVVFLADVMDREPVAIPGDLSVEQALDEYFLRYRWPWFPVVDAAHRFLGLVMRDRADEVPEISRSSSHVSDLVDHDIGLFVRDDTPLDSLLANQNLRRLGALMAVDAEGRLSGVVTIEQVGRALRDSTAR